MGPDSVVNTQQKHTDNLLVKISETDDIAKQFRAQTGENIAVAGTKLAGQELHRAASKVEKDLYTPDQVAMVEKWGPCATHRASIFSASPRVKFG